MATGILAICFDYDGHVIRFDGDARAPVRPVHVIFDGRGLLDPRQNGGVTRAGYINAVIGFRRTRQEPDSMFGCEREHGGAQCTRIRLRWRAMLDQRVETRRVVRRHVGRLTTVCGVLGERRLADAAAQAGEHGDAQSDAYGRDDERAHHQFPVFGGAVSRPAVHLVLLRGDQALPVFARLMTGDIVHLGDIDHGDHIEIHAGFHVLRREMQRTVFIACGL